MEPNAILYITCCFVIAGTVKGLIGLGFPTIILATLALTIGVHEAMALMLLPCFFTNVWQALWGGHIRRVLRKIWPLLLTAICTILLTTSYIGQVNTVFVSCLLGLVVSAYGCLGLLAPRLHIGPRRERWLTPVVGMVNGVITGLTGSFVVPGVFYLQSLKLEKDTLIQAMGILFLLSTLALGAGLMNANQIDSTLLTLSAAAIVPSFMGMWAGQQIRRRVPETTFRTVFFYALLILGISIIIRSLV